MSGEHVPGRPGDRRRDRTIGVVLAAGEGRRFGMPKIIAQQGDWLGRAVSALSVGGCAEVVVAMGAAIVEPPEGAQVLRVDDWREGMSSAVRSAVQHTLERPEFGGVLLHVVDTPDVGAEVIARILDTVDGDRSALARAIYDGRPGHPVYLGADHLDPVLPTLAGDVGARAYLRAHRDTLRLIECGDLATGRDHDHPGP